MASIRSALSYTLLSSNAGVILQFVGSLFLARLLTPAQFGSYSVAAVVVAMAQLLRDFGASAYVVQANTLTREMLRAAFGLMLLTAWGAALALFALAQPIADFYRDGSIAQVMRVLSLSFLFVPFGAVSMACARRELRFGAIALIEGAAGIVQLLVSVLLAFLGWGALSLAWAAVAGALATVIGTCAIRQPDAPWLPSLRGVRAVARFGASIASASTLGHLGNNSPDLVIGRLIDVHAVGVFNRAASLNRMFGNMLQKTLGPVLLPALAQLKREGTDLQGTFLRGTVRITGLTWPVYLTIGVMGDSLIRTLFGPQWSEAVPLVPFICATAAYSSTFTLCGALYVARGQPQLNVRLEAWGLAVKVGAIVAAAPFGLFAVALTWPLITLISSLYHLRLLRRQLRVPARQLARELRLNCVIALLCAGAALLVDQLIRSRFGSTAAPLACVAGGLAAALVWMACLHRLAHPLAEELRRAQRALQARWTSFRTR
ncbi:oligosaccharide flippase family protein [Niveibacterium sp. SC-1]|uniref:oligosaccharide flippase family protein n=1 Tax=Niveibacterium sp. SC-1 TaxID=3135646 RepID=UPI0031203569